MRLTAVQWTQAIKLRTNLILSVQIFLDAERLFEMMSLDKTYDIEPK